MRQSLFNDFVTINEAYAEILEAQARPLSYKNLTPEQAEALAQLSPSYKSNQVWGLTSNWICSAANRMIKYRNLPFETVYEKAKSTSAEIAAFEANGKKLKKDINSIQTFDELKTFMQTAKENGLTENGLSNTAKGDGRARQCYSFMKNGGDNFDITYEDSNWIIGYPKNYDYNSKFSSIGKWCHTGSFGDGLRYWGQYASYPVFYILNKQDGTVLCASYQDGSGEVRDQKDNYPIGFNGRNWNEFFTELGLKKPMVDDIHYVLSVYVEPDDVSKDVWDRVDENLVDSELFAGLGATLEGDDYGNGTGNFWLSMPFSSIDPNNPETDTAFHTRYLAKPDTDEFYTFEEFKMLSKATWNSEYSNKSEVGELARMILSSQTFRTIWETETDMQFYGLWRTGEIKDDKTMASRLSLDELLEIINGGLVNFCYDYRRKCKAIRENFLHLIKAFDKKFMNVKKAALPSNIGSIDIYDDKITISIDADEANTIATRLSNGEVERDANTDILSLNLRGANTFAVKRVNIDNELGMEINNFIAYCKRIALAKLDLEGQMLLDLRDKNGDIFIS